jgi:hypothetical protein
MFGIEYLTNRFERGRIHDKIRAFFNPRQKWLTKHIPNTWCDKTELIPTLLFACLIDFVESEKGTEQLHVDWSEDLEKGYVTPEYVDSVKRIYSELEEAYRYVKNERPWLQNALNASYPEINFGKDNTISTAEPYHIAYAETNRIEKEIEDKDYWAMNIIIKHVGVLWT